MKKFTLKIKVFLLLFLTATGIMEVYSQQWQKLQTGVTEDLYDICCTDANTVFVCGQNGVILKTEDGGETWQEKHRNQGWEIFSIKFSDEINGYALVLNENQFFIIKTEDYGETWFQITRKNMTIEKNRYYSNEIWGIYGKPMELYLANNGNLIVIEYGNLCRSTDDGETFEDIDLDIEDKGWSAHFYDNYGLVIGCDKYNENVMKIIKTYDYGDNWENVYSYDFSSCDISSVYYESKSCVKIYGEFSEDGNVFFNVIETNDSFETFTMSNVYDLCSWRYFDIDFSNERGCFVNSVVLNKDPINSNVYVTKDGGTTWSEVSHGLNKKEFMYCVSAIDSVFLIASQNGTLYMYDNSPIQGVEENKTELNIFPNPIGQTLEITSTNTGKIEIIDNFGRKTKEFPKEQERVLIDISNLASGIYFVKLKTENGHELTERIVKE